METLPLPLAPSSSAASLSAEEEASAPSSAGTRGSFLSARTSGRLSLSSSISSMRWKEPMREAGRSLLNCG